MSATPKTETANNQEPAPLTKAESDFIEERGLKTQEDGLSRTLGRIWALLMLREGPLDADEISELLKVSRGSISTNMRTLKSMNLVSLRTVPGERRDYFSISDSPYEAMIAAQIAKFDAQAKDIRGALGAAQTPHAINQLKQLASFFEIMRDGYARGLEEHEKKSP